MDQVDEFLRNADECLQMAKQQRNPALKEQFLELARQWGLLAAARERSLKPKEMH